MNILVLNGPSLNLLGLREPEIYGSTTYDQLVEMIERKAKELGIRVKVFQSNHEGRLIDEIHRAYGKFEGIIINAGAYTHTSVALLDALRAVNIPAVEVHISDINKREDFRKISYISLYAERTIAGKGVDGYLEALEYFKDKK